MNAIKGQRFEEAAGLLTKVIASRPADVPPRWLLVQALEGQGDANSAMEQLGMLLSHIEKDLPAIDRIAAYMHKGRYPLRPVLDAYEHYLSFKPSSSNAAFNYAWYLAKDGQFEAAIKWYERALQLGISAPEEVHLNIANICMDHLYARDAAREQLEKALALSPGYSSAHYNLGNLAEQDGDRDRASDCFERCLQADPANESALARLADTRKFTDRDDPLLARLVKTAKDSANSDVHFALGKAREQLGDFELAWDSFSKGNELDDRVWPAYSPSAAEAHVEQIMSIGPGTRLESNEPSSGAPVFICGMFRSGSTLLEQVLAAHPRFVAGGESEFFPRLVAREFPDYPLGLGEVSIDELRSWQQQHAAQLIKLLGNSSRPTDKRPDNFLYLGLIRSVVPAAKFIATERDWRDIAASVYSVRLGPGQAYARNLRDIRHYIGLQSKLMDHWESLLGPDLIRVRYEDLVQHPEETVAELLEFLGERWDERCLSFHELRNSVRTASVWQVREPLHIKSIGRWKHYERQFVDVFGDGHGLSD